MHTLLSIIALVLFLLSLKNIFMRPLLGALAALAAKAGHKDLLARQELEKEYAARQKAAGEGPEDSKPVSFLKMTPAQKAELPEDIREKLDAINAGSLMSGGSSCLLLLAGILVAVVFLGAEALLACVPTPGQPFGIALVLYSAVTGVIYATRARRKTQELLKKQEESRIEESDAKGLSEYKWTSRLSALISCVLAGLYFAKLNGFF